MINNLQGRVTYIWFSKLGQHCFRSWLVTCLVPTHYLTPCWHIVNSTLGNKFQWHHNQKIIFIQQSGSEKAVCQISAILSWPKCVKLSVEISAGIVMTLHRWQCDQHSRINSYHTVLHLTWSTRTPVILQLNYLLFTKCSWKCVCKMVAILVRSQCVYSLRPSDLYGNKLGHHWFR